MNLRPLVVAFVGKKYNLNFVAGFHVSDIIINFSTCMHAKQMVLYSFER